MKTLVGLAFVISWTSVLGCGGGGPSLEAVTGKVMNGDAPLAVGTVTFHPDKSKGNESGKQAQGEIGSDGTYKLMTDGAEGAPAGWYKVTVYAEKPRSEDGPDAYAPPEFLVKESFTKAETTTLSVEVKADAPAGHYDLKVTPK